MNHLINKSLFLTRRSISSYGITIIPFTIGFIVGISGTIVDYIYKIKILNKELIKDNKMIKEEIEKLKTTKTTNQ